MRRLCRSKGMHWCSGLSVQVALLRSAEALGLVDTCSAIQTERTDIAVKSELHSYALRVWDKRGTE